MANYGAINSLELERIACPVLLVHGDADTDPAFSHTAHHTLPDSELGIMTSGTHLCLYAPPHAPTTPVNTGEIQHMVCEFLARRA